MKHSVILICLLFLSGCSSIHQTINNHAPVLLVQRPFPSVPLSLTKPDILLATDILISEDGSVVNVILRTGSGIKAWDSIAVETIRTWEYSPMRVNNNPVACWVHQKMRIRIAEPIIYSLSALLFPSYEIADSFYTYLVEGRKFEEIANSVSLFPTLGKFIDIGKVDIHQYSEFIRNSLTNLSEGEFTKPIKYDDHYIIFKRAQSSQN
jgi:TonB family protein